MNIRLFCQTHRSLVSQWPTPIPLMISRSLFIIALPRHEMQTKNVAHSLIGHPVHRVELKAEPVGHAHFTSDLADVLGNLVRVQRWFLDNVSALQNFEDRYKGRTDWPILPTNLLSAQDQTAPFEHIALNMSELIFVCSFNSPLYSQDDAD